MQSLDPVQTSASSHTKNCQTGVSNFDARYPDYADKTRRIETIQQARTPPQGQSAERLARAGLFHVGKCTLKFIECRTVSVGVSIVLYSLYIA